jgi:hypothetical protein
LHEAFKFNLKGECPPIHVFFLNKTFFLFSLFFFNFQTINVCEAVKQVILLKIYSTEKSKDIDLSLSIKYSYFFFIVFQSIKEKKKIEEEKQTNKIFHIRQLFVRFKRKLKSIHKYLWIIQICILTREQDKKKLAEKHTKIDNKYKENRRKNIRQKKKVFSVSAIL